MKKEASEAMSDTGTSFIGGPKSEIERIAKAVGAKYVEEYEVYEISCNAKPPSINIYIGANKYSIEYANYIVDAGDGMCILTLFAEESLGFGPPWLLGDPFIRQYCNIHDMKQKRIGFAKPIAK
ncbi:unnamed protein product [Strongylus vulgaris]|uniref:Peptidase A1 domain-containing protein n=1 Tax=Strongylus vulgaris TaxID=40348 RepID=A0A3P7IYY0_STRVU|nr:unnamed protein product [Strongylus vulgaris]